MKKDKKILRKIVVGSIGLLIMTPPSYALISENATCYTGYAIVEYEPTETLSEVLSPESNATEIVASCIEELVETQTEITREEIAETVDKPNKNDYVLRKGLSAQQTIYFLLTEKYGYSQAGACGIMANIQAECGFNCNDVTGKYYGLFQLGDGRLSNMKKYCNANGYSWKSIQGQIAFMNYELNSYPSLKSLLKSASGVSGAKKAAYQFSMKYERPAGKEKSANRRAGYAATIFNKRNSYGSTGMSKTAETQYQMAMDKYNAEVDRLYAIAANKAVYEQIS